MKGSPTKRESSVSPDDLVSAKMRLAEFEVRSAEQARQRLQEQHDAGARWLLASLFAINAGGVLSIFNSERLEGVWLVDPLSLYFIGVILTFTMGVSVQLSDRRMVAAVHSWGQLWTKFLALGAIPEDEEREAKVKILAAEKVGSIGRNFELVAMLVWIASSAWIALALILE